MDEIGIRDLKATLSSVLRRVSEGRTVRVTVRGRAIAEIVPPGTVGPDDSLRALVAAGRVAPPVQPRPNRAPRMVTAQRSASELVTADREAER
jgi:prevent-host-death family protein